MKIAHYYLGLNLIIFIYIISDIVGFTAYSSKTSPQMLVAALNEQV